VLDPETMEKNDRAPQDSGAGETLTFEQGFEQLQALVRQLESGELSLEDSLKAFERGVKLTRLCQERLGAAEQRIELLTQVNADGSVQTQPFGGGVGQRS
jgi:exodeoxyribonuclease VII small subunit